MSLAENLLELRTKKGFTQQQIAGQVSITTRAYQNYEAGTRVPPLSTLIALADFYDLSLDELVGRER